MRNPEYTDNPKGIRQQLDCGEWIWASEEDGGWDEQPQPPSWAQLDRALTLKRKLHPTVCDRKEN